MERELKEREGLYSLLRALFSYPLTETVLGAVASLALEPGSPMAPGLRQLQQRIREAVDGRALVEALNVEMSRLMEGPGRVPAPPFASFYLHGERLMGPAAAAARRFYLQWSAMPDTEWRIPPDHIALELGFLAYLARRAAEATHDAERWRILQASREFLRRHVLPWLPRFCEALASSTTDPFFIGLAAFTHEAVRLDLEWLDAVLAEHSDSLPSDERTGRSS
jgi:TorA maturation chaperone TorD